MEIIVLRLVHIVGSILWVGAAVFNMVFLAPTLRRVGPSAGPVMVALRRRGSSSSSPWWRSSRSCPGSD